MSDNESPVPPDVRERWEVFERWTETVDRRAFRSTAHECWGEEVADAILDLLVAKNRAVEAVHRAMSRKPVHEDVAGDLATRGVTRPLDRALVLAMDNINELMLWVNGIPEPPALHDE